MSLEAIRIVTSHFPMSRQLAGLCYTLASYHNTERNQCNPSIRTLAEQLCCDERTILRDLKAAEEKGIIRRHTVIVDGGMAPSNIQFLSPDGTDMGDTPLPTPPSGPYRHQRQEAPDTSVVQKQELKQEEIDIVSQQFDEFWSLYPRKSAKKPSRTKWNRLTKKNREAALNHMRRHPYADRDPQFIPHPSTYLNQERWNDQPDLLTIPDNVTHMRGI